MTIKDKKGNTTPTAVNISQGINPFHLTQRQSRNFMSMPITKGRWVVKALKEMQAEIKAWQKKIKDVVEELKTNKVAVVNSAGNSNIDLEELDPKLRKQMEKDAAINPLLVGTGIIGVGATDTNGKLTTYSTRGNHYQFATTVPDGKKAGTSYTAPAFSVILTKTMRDKQLTVNEALAYLKKQNPLKIDDQGNAYTYIPLPKKKKK